MKSRFFKGVMIACAAALLSACVAPPYYEEYDYGKNYMPVVSASGHDDYTKEYLSSTQPGAAQSKVQLETLQRENALLKARLEEEERREVVQISSEKRNELSTLWGTPLGSVGQGVSLLDDELRRRLNDALGTTPPQGQAQWQLGGRNFVFKPNSPVYQPFHSGGNCRDGIFIHFDGMTSETLRGLFCQQGRGADWFLVR